MKDDKVCGASRSITQMLKERKARILELAKEVKKYIDIMDVPSKALDGITCRIAGVDGGYHFFEDLLLNVMVVRAASVLFEIENGRLKDVKLIPSGYVRPKLVLLEEGEDEVGKSIMIQTVRVLEEIKVAREMAEKERPDFLFLHGPLLPHFLARDATIASDGRSTLHTHYRAILENLGRIMEVADETGMILAGIVEDSRGKTIVKTLEEGVSTTITDCLVLDVLLERCEYTTPLLYDNPVMESSVSRLYPELKERMSRIFVFYVKNASEDLPLRIEFYLSRDARMEEVAEKLAATALMLTFTNTYAMPSVLIEADRRARIKRKEAELFLASEFGSEILSLIKRRKKRFL